MQFNSMSIEQQQKKYSPFKWLTMLFMFLYISTLYYLSYSDKYNIVSKIIFAVLVFLTFIRVLIERGIIKVDYFAIALVLFFCYCGISSLWVVCSEGVASFVITMLQLVLLFFVIRININSEKDFRVVFWAMFVGTVVMCIYAVSFYGVNGIFELLSSGGRIGSEINQSNVMGLYCDILCIMCLYLIYWEKKKWVYLFLFLSVFTLVATTSRRALILALLLFFILFVFKNKKGRIKRAVIIIIATGIVVYFILNMAESRGYFHRLSQLFFIFTSDSDILTDGSLLTRVSFFTLAFELFCQKPIFGHGSVQFEYYYSLRNGSRRPPHSTFLQVLVGYGLIGFCIFYGMYVYSLVKIIPMLKAKRKYSIMIFTIIVIMLVNDVGTNMLPVKIPYIIFAILSSYFAMTLDEEKNN